PPPSPASPDRPRAGGDKRGKRKILLTSLPRTALRLSGATLVSSLWDFGLARCARKWPERADEPSGADSELSEKRPSRTAPSAWFARQTLRATNRHGVVVVV